MSKTQKNNKQKAKAPMPQKDAAKGRRQQSLQLSSRLSCGVNAILTVAFAAIVLVFFGACYSGHLNYHEQLQLFLYTKTYAAGVMLRPEGVAEYVSRFVIQMFYYPWLGAAFISLLLTALQLSVLWLMPRRGMAGAALSFLPALLMWAAICNEDTMLTATVALLIAFALAGCVRYITAVWPRRIVEVVAIPLVYMMCGPIAIVYVLLCVLCEWRRVDKRLAAIVSSIVAVAVYCLCPVMAHAIFKIPVDQLWQGAHYMRFASFTPTMVWVAAISALAVVPLSLIFPDKWRSAKSAVTTAVIVLMAVASVGGVVIKNNSDFEKEHIFAIDALARKGQWSAIVESATNRMPKSQMEVIYLNLALAKTHQLTERMFEFFQNGTDGLLPAFGDNFFLPFATAEAYYNIGLTKPAMLFTFEIAESVPDGQQSARCVSRLAQTALANGDVQLARKYLNTLTHSLFYADWAKQRLAHVNNNTADPELSLQRDNVLTNAAFISVDDARQSLNALLAQHRTNSLAYEYLLAWYLLSLDIEALPQALSQGDISYDTLPKGLQEALVLLWSHDHNNFDGMPWPLTDDVRARFLEFAKIFRPDMKASMMPESLSDTYWAYYFR